MNIQIAYSGENEIIKQSLGFGDLRVVGRSGFSQFAKLLSTEANQTGFDATYQVVPSNTTWLGGIYRVEMKAFQVTDQAGNHVREELLGEFELPLPQDRDR